jgi:hypothetical protein
MYRPQYVLVDWGQTRFGLISVHHPEFIGNCQLSASVARTWGSGPRLFVVDGGRTADRLGTRDTGYGKRGVGKDHREWRDEPAATFQPQGGVLI